MKRSRFLVPALVVLLGLPTAIPCFAASKKKPKKPPALIQSPTISSVTASSITINDGTVTKTFTITQFTEIIVNGQKATAALLKPGMVANVTMGTDPTKASRISATGK
jgi:hypothetical protein